MDAAELATFGIAASFYPQSGGGPIAISGIVKPPALEEEQSLPGGAYDIANVSADEGGGATLRLRSRGSSLGVSVVRLFVRPDTIAPAPQIGDVVTVP